MVDTDCVSRVVSFLLFDMSAPSESKTVPTTSRTTVTTDLPRSITSKKLDGLNYLSWAHAVKVYLRGKREMKFITDSPPPKGDASLSDWEAEDSDLMCRLWHSLEPHVAITVEFCDTSKQIWDALAESFSQKSNVSRVFELYEQIFTTKQSGKSLPEYYSTLKSLWDQLLQHRPFTSDLQQQQRYWEDFMVASLLFGLDSDLKGFKDQILASETLPTAANAYSRLSRSSLGQSSHLPRSVAPTPESSALVSSHGGQGNYRGPVRSFGRGDGRNFQGNGGFGRGDSRNFHGSGGNGSFRGGGRTGGRGNRKCDHCGATNHSEPYCWKKYGKPDYVHQVSDNAPPSQPQLSADSSRYGPTSDSHDALTTQVSELVQTLRLALPSTNPTATLANSGPRDDEDDWFGA